MPIQWTTALTLGVPRLDAQPLELDRQLALVRDLEVAAHARETAPEDLAETAP